MTKFALRYPYLIIVICLITCVVGVTSLLRMPVDLFPPIKIPVVVVATFFSGMPPEQIENDITGRFERFFTLGSGIDHIESRSLPGVSLIKVYFQPGSNPDTAVSTIANLASANLRRLPPGTLPPVVLKFDASSLPVCLVTLKGDGLNETRLRDLGQYTVRNQVANVPGASVPQPFGGRYRQIMVYVDPLKLEAHQLSVMDVVRAVNDSNLILPAGDVRIGPFDYNIYANSQLRDIDDINRLPLKTVGNASVLVGDVGMARDASQIQNNIVRVDGQRSVYLPVLKQGGDANTISVVDGIKHAVSHLLDVPGQLVTKVVFDQSVFVKNAIENLLHEGAIGLVLTGVMILVFLASSRATLAVFLSIPLSALATFIALGLGGGTVNTMILGGLALVFSRLIDNSVVVLENIFRHLELGETPAVAAEKGGSEVALPVLAATLTTAVVFFPVTFLYGVSRFLFSALALAVVLALFASYFVALTVVPLFCSRFIKQAHGGHEPGRGAASLGQRFNHWFNARFTAMLHHYGRLLNWSLDRPWLTLLSLSAVFVLSLLLFRFVGVSYFPRTDPGQFVINLKAPTGTRLEKTDALVQQVEDIIHEVVSSDDLGVVVANLGVTPGFSSIYTSNSGQHTAFVQVSLREGHRVGSYEYMDRVRRRLKAELPQLSAYIQSGGLVDAILNLGLPAPIDIQVSGSNLEAAHQTASEIARKLRAVPGVSDILIPQDIDYPAIQLDIDRVRASQLGLTSKEVVGNIITALTSDAMIAPSYWVDPRSGNDYLLTVQYPENTVTNLHGLQAIPLRSPGRPNPTRLDAVSSIKHIHAPTEVDHYQLRRVIDVYVAPSSEDLGGVLKEVNRIVAETPPPEGVRINLRGMVQGMNASFHSFGFGLVLSLILVYLILVAQFQSFVDPFLILLAVPTGLTGVVVTLLLTGTTLNVMSLMGVVMMAGIVVSNSILIVEFTHRLREDGKPLREAIALACRVRLRPVLMTSLATLIGLIPMAAKLGTGSEAYAPLARAIIGGLAFSVVLTMFIVPAAYLLVYRRRGKTGRRRRGGGLVIRLHSLLLAVAALSACQLEAQTNTNAMETLTLRSAGEIAIANHPRITSADLLALASKQAVREARSAYLPTVTANITAVGAADDNTRIAAGGLNNPLIIDRNSEGINISQLITDFGRTANLTASSKLRSRAAAESAVATRAQILLEVSAAYFDALEAQSVLEVARQTVATRQLLFDQVNELAKNNLKSELDVSFAQVSLEESRLLQARARNDLQASFAVLSNLLGERTQPAFKLADEPIPSTNAPDASELVELALRQRPDLARWRFERDAAAKFARAEHDLHYPTISAAAAAGISPVRDSSRLNDTYAAAGVNVSIPIFDGLQFTARSKEAELKARAIRENLREAENNVVRDVRVAALNLQYAAERMQLTAKLRQSAEKAFELAEARYKVGSSSIVELSQAQLGRTEAQIAQAKARYEFQTRNAILQFQTGQLR